MLLLPMLLLQPSVAAATRRRWPFLASTAAAAADVADVAANVAD